MRAIEQIVKTGADGTKTVVGWKESVDPKKFARSSDAYRRHLTPEQKRAVIADDIKEDPHASDLKIARERNVKPHTVAKVRARQGVPDLQNANLVHKPIERARAVLNREPRAEHR